MIICNLFYRYNCYKKLFKLLDIKCYFINCFIKIFKINKPFRNITYTIQIKQSKYYNTI